MEKKNGTLYIGFSQKNIPLKNGDIHMKGEIFSVLLNGGWDQIIVEDIKLGEVKKKLKLPLHIISLQQEELAKVFQQE